jgi:hypothetical protein
MRIGILRISTVMVAAALTSLGAPSSGSEGYTFAGRLAYRAWDGGLIPVVPDVVLVGWGDGRCQFTLQSPADLKVGSDGGFRVGVEETLTEVTRVATLRPDGSTEAPTCIENTSWPCYRFRASGCEDRILQFGPKRPDALVEVNCPARKGPRVRRDG